MENETPEVELNANQPDELTTPSEQSNIEQSANDETAKIAERQRVFDGQLSAEVRKVMAGDRNLDDVPAYLKDAVAKEVNRREADKTAKLSEQIREDMRFEELKGKITSSLDEDQVKALETEMENLNPKLSKSERLEKASKILGVYPQDSQTLRRNALMGAMTMPVAGATPTKATKSDAELVSEMEKIRRG